MVSPPRRAVILLAEDDPGDQELSRRALENGKLLVDLHVVENGEEAMDYLLRKGKYQDPATSPRPDLFLLDLNMPRMDGRQVLEAMAGNPECPRVTTLVMTTSRQEEDILRSYRLGVKSYIPKPLDMDAFIHVVRTIEEYWFEVVVMPPAGN
jgi:CheY-like chemotaxis protein